MVRGLFWISWVAMAGGCVALNPGFEDSGEGTGGVASSDTGRKTTSESDTEPSAGGSAVTTVTASGGVTSDPTDSGITTVADTGGPDPQTSSGESSGTWGTSWEETGDIPCIPVSGDVSDDAFLVDCDEDCSVQNYGQTPARSLHLNDEGFSELFLRVPVEVDGANQIAVTIEVVAGDGLAQSDLSLFAYAFDPPCDWSEGQRNGGFLPPGESGVTAVDCDGNPEMLAPWNSGGSFFWDYENLDWERGETRLEAGKFLLDTPLTVTIFLEREDAGSVPEALLIQSDAQVFGDAVVTAAEGGGNGPRVDVYAECR